MTHEEQYDWMDKRAFKSPYWAKQEFEIRQHAAQVVDELYASEEGFVTVAIMRPGRGPLGFEYDTVKVYRNQIARVGGLEGVLVVEEIIRRAMGLSHEALAEARLADARAALGHSR